MSVSGAAGGPRWDGVPVEEARDAALEESPSDPAGVQRGGEACRACQDERPKPIDPKLKAAEDAFTAYQKASPKQKQAAYEKWQKAFNDTKALLSLDKSSSAKSMRERLDFLSGQIEADRKKSGGKTGEVPSKRPQIVPRSGDFF